MKKLLFISALLCVLCSCGSGNKNALTGTHENHEWVDLGLPSGLKWATCNVGALNPSDYGNYYAWGEINTKSEYDIENSVFFKKQMCDIGGDPALDAATANWGGRWRMPTKDEFQELIDKCTWTWTTQDGNEGYKVTGPNGNSIFLPAAGYRNGTLFYLDGQGGFYLSSTPVEKRVGSEYHLEFHSSFYGMDNGTTSRGRCVRPVLED